MGSGSRSRKFPSHPLCLSPFLYPSSLRLIFPPGTVSSLRLNSPAKPDRRRRLFQSSLTTVGGVAGSASVSEEEVEGVSLEKYVKSRLPGGFAAQRIIGNYGRRKCVIARVALQEGTRKFVINYRDSQEVFCLLFFIVLELEFKESKFILEFVGLVLRYRKDYSMKKPESIVPCRILR
ncbi:hypothetical protein ZIOFF_008587 [Zingiber officinale]|uniref:30S ribosomal protein S9, chloroplastic n=1 Tax=Zingiber officinale TaxID=94328 RepID=A0A8J5I3J3_ZINOF|nr:hypothetical protein ZIOFF_008587 [Zingiber officinale]